MKKQEKRKKRIKAVSPLVTVVLFVVAVAMLLGGSIGGTRAALTYYSDPDVRHRRGVDRKWEGSFLEGL